MELTVHTEGSKCVWVRLAGPFLCVYGVSFVLPSEGTVFQAPAGAVHLSLIGRSVADSVADAASWCWMVVLISPVVSDLY